MLLLIFVLHSVALASLEDNFGLGGSTTGRIGLVASEPKNPYAALYNPALLSTRVGSNFGFATLSTETRYDSLKNVLLDSPLYRTEEGLKRTGDLEIAQSSILQWTLGVTNGWGSTLLGRMVGLGITLSGPYEKIRSIAASTPYDFSALKYGNSDRQFKGTVGLGVEILPELLSVGAGLTFYMTTNGAADTTLIAENPTSRMAVDMGYNSAGIVGLFFHDEEIRASLVFRQALDPSFEEKISGSVQLGGTSVLSQPLWLRTSLYYEPAKLALEYSHRFDDFSIHFGVQYENWQAYRPPFLITETIAADGSRQQTRSAPVSLRSTWNPRASLSIPLFDEVQLDLGYSFRPTPVIDLSGVHNLIDSNTHILGLAASHHWSNPVWEDFDWGIYGQLHWFQPREIVKANSELIGAPGYRVSGRSTAVGLFVQAGL